MGGKVIGACVACLVVGFVAGAAAAWGLDPADEPDPDRAAGVDEGRTDFVVFLDQDVAATEVAAIETELRNDQRIYRLDYFDDEESREEYRTIFADNEAMIERIEENPDLLPTTFRFTTPTTDEAVVEDILAGVGDADAVLKISATLTTRATLDPGREIRWG